MTATPTPTSEGTTGAAPGYAVMDLVTLQAWAQRARDRAEELMLRSASVLARSGELQVRLGPRATPADPEEGPGLLAAAQTRIAHLERALVSNRRIAMALGVLMARHRLTEQQAFDLLREQSSRRNVKLAAIAEEVIYTGDL
jgi:ANTAR domain